MRLERERERKKKEDGILFIRSSRDISRQTNCDVSGQKRERFFLQAEHRRK